MLKRAVKETSALYDVTEGISVSQVPLSGHTADQVLAPPVPLGVFPVNTGLNVQVSQTSTQLLDN